MKAIAYAMVAVLLPAAGGCIIVPVPMLGHTGYGPGRGPVGEDARKFLDGPQPTKEDVLINLGQPDKASTDESTFVYRWDTVRAYIMWGTILRTGGTETITTPVELQFDFDSAHRVKSYKLRRIRLLGTDWQVVAEKSWP